jgi:hypothetical protein
MIPDRGRYNTAEFSVAESASRLEIDNKTAIDRVRFNRRKNKTLPK